MMRWNNMIHAGKVTVRFGEDGYEIRIFHNGNPKGYDPMKGDGANEVWTLATPHKSVGKWLGNRGDKLNPGNIVSKIRITDETDSDTVMQAIVEEIRSTLIDLGCDSETLRATKPWLGKRLTWKKVG